jgi:hypothetical protein
VDFERKFRTSALATALLLGASGAVAAAREPLIVTELRDPNLIPLAGTGRSVEQSLDDATRRFSLAIAQAIESDQRMMDRACRAGAPEAANHAARFDWQANCLYHRH